MYQSSLSSGAIGTLLRSIVEQKNENPIIPPKAESGAPTREVIQQPLSNPESPGTNQVISIKPEAINNPGINSSLEGTPQRSQIGAPAIGGPGSSENPTVGLTPSGAITYLPNLPSYNPNEPVDPPPPSQNISNTTNNGSSSEKNSVQPSKQTPALPPTPVGNIKPVSSAPSPAVKAADRMLEQEKSDTNQAQLKLLQDTTNYLNNPTAPGAQKQFQNSANQVLGLSTKISPTPAPVYGPAYNPNQKVSQNPLQYLLGLATKLFGGK